MVKFEVAPLHWAHGWRTLETRVQGRYGRRHRGAHARRCPDRRASTGNLQGDTHREWPITRNDARSARHAARSRPRAPAPYGSEERMRSRAARRLHHDRRWPPHQFLPDARRFFKCAKVTRIEGLETGGDLHPMQAASLEHDGFQCGFCTAGPICSAVAMWGEAHVEGLPDLSQDEIRERERQYLPLRRVPEHCRCRACGAAGRG